MLCAWGGFACIFEQLRGGRERKAEVHLLKFVVCNHQLLRFQLSLLLIEVGNLPSPIHRLSTKGEGEIVGVYTHAFFKDS